MSMTTRSESAKRRYNYRKKHKLCMICVKSNDRAPKIHCTSCAKRDGELKKKRALARRKGDYLARAYR